MLVMRRKRVTMNKIDAIVRPEKLYLLRDKLDQKGFLGMTVAEVRAGESRKISDCSGGQ